MLLDVFEFLPHKNFVKNSNGTQNKLSISKYTLLV